MYFCSMYTHFTISEDEVIILLLLGLGCHSNKHFVVKKKNNNKELWVNMYMYQPFLPFKKA